MKKALLDDLEGCYSLPAISDTLEICSFLDPRYKQNYLKNIEETKVAITHECLNLPASADDEASSPQASAVESPPPPKRSKGLGAILKPMAINSQPETSITPEQKVENEISSYINFPNADVESDPLLWWKAEH